jgi:hypothetical protein
MVKKCFLLVVLFSLFIPAFAQVKVVGFKKLQQFLPVEVAGYDRQKPTGSTQSVMNMTMSEAEVRFLSKPHQSENDTTPTIEIKIAIHDASQMPYMIIPLTMIQQNYEAETETGFEKSYMVKGQYAGKLSAQTSDSKSCKLDFGVMNRFLINLEAEGTDNAALLVSIAEKMDLDGLVKVEPDK